MGSCQSGIKLGKNKIIPILGQNKINPIAIKKNISIKKKKKHIPKALKKLVWDTWIGPTVGCTKCLCCEHEEIRQIEFHCGHIISEAKGGENKVDNLKPICAQCNLSMGTMDMNEFKEKYFKNIKVEK